MHLFLFFKIVSMCNEECTIKKLSKQIRIFKAYWQNNCYSSSGSGPFRWSFRLPKPAWWAASTARWQWPWKGSWLSATHFFQEGKISSTFWNNGNVPDFTYRARHCALQSTIVFYVCLNTIYFISLTTSLVGTNWVFSQHM